MAQTYSFDALIVGGGAAGLMCAIEAGKRGRRVAILEHADGLGKKILISGGGRCNFTNIHCQPENFISANPNFAKSALARYTPEDFVALIEKHDIPYHEKTLGQLFCDRTARDILGMLEEECRAVKVNIFLGRTIQGVRRTTQFILKANGDEFIAPTLVIASGGLSIPKIGATSFGYDVAQQFGLKIKEPRPGLVPLVLSETDRKHWCDLSGVSAEVIASCDGQHFREKMLITHRGLSGPALLQISSYWSNKTEILIDMAPNRSIISSFRYPQIQRSTAGLRNEMKKHLPHRLAERWVELHAPESWRNPALEQFERDLHAWAVAPAGTEGFEKAEVTVGGVDTGELSGKTMESRKVPGLYFIGEIVDVTGQLGGFNFQWAWSSGVAAGRAL